VGRNELDEVATTRAILAEQNAVMMDYPNLECAVVGAGPAGPTAAAYLADAGIKTGVIEKRPSIGGGMLISGRRAAEIVIENLRQLLFPPYRNRVV